MIKNQKNPSSRIFIAIGAFICTATFAQDEATAYPPSKVEVATAESRQMAPIVDVSGTVISLNDSRIAAEVEGVLTWMANVGDAVEGGEVIAKIDPRLMQVALRRARANVARLESDLVYREQQLKRNQGLAATNNASATLLDESRAQRDAALHQLDDARAWQDRAQGDLERTQIRAAFAGHVTERLASVGEYMGIGEDVLRLVDTHHIEIALPASISLAPFVSPGLQVQVRNAGVQRQHSVRTVVPVGDAVSRMVEIRLSAAAGDWLVGTPVQVGLPSSTPVNAIAIPRDALVQKGGQSFVFKINSDGTAEQITAKISATVGLWVGISEGIEAGDQVVIRGAERLSSGQSVEIIASADAR